MPSHSDWAKPKLRLREGYATTWAAKRRRHHVKPIRLSQNLSCGRGLAVQQPGRLRGGDIMPNQSDWAKPTLGTKGNLCNKRGDKEAATSCQTTQTGPNLKWE